MLSTRQDILKRANFKTKDISVDGMTLRVKEMSGMEKARFEAFILKHTKEAGKETAQVDPTKLRLGLFIFCVCDENNKLIFSENDAEELSNSLSKSVLFEVSEAASEVNETNTEEQVKNSEAVPPGNLNLS